MSGGSPVAPRTLRVADGGKRNRTAGEGGQRAAARVIARSGPDDAEEVEERILLAKRLEVLAEDRGALRHTVTKSKQTTHRKRIARLAPSSDPNI